MGLSHRLIALGMLACAPVYAQPTPSQPSGPTPTPVPVPVPVQPSGPTPVPVPVPVGPIGPGAAPAAPGPGQTPTQAPAPAPPPPAPAPAPPQYPPPAPPYPAQGVPTNQYPPPPPGTAQWPPPGYTSTAPTMPGGLPAGVDPNGMTTTQIAPPETGPKKPKKGDFDAGGDVKFPSGPDSMGHYATYNWITANLKGKYNLLDTITANLNLPLALIKPGKLMDGESPDLIGGATARLDATLPKLPSLPGMRNNDAQIGLTLTLAYMRERAMLLSDKDFPLFVGKFEPGINLGLIAKLKLSSLVDFSFVPVWMHQGGGDFAGVSAVQIPLSLILKLGSLVQLSYDLGIYTGANYSFSSANDGRISTGASLTVKIGPIIAHAGAGFASLITGGQGMYPSIGDSLYVDLNVKYAK